jgi:DNA replication protein DnaC
MEPLKEILKKTEINTHGANMATSSNPEKDASCPLCRGAGFVYPLLPDGKPDFTSVVPCRCALSKIEKERQDNLEKTSRIGALRSLTFDELAPEGRSGSVICQERFRVAYEAARRFAQNPVGWITFTGPSGSGKTHLAAAIANERINNGEPVLFITASELLDHLRSAFSPESELPYDRLFAQIKDAPLLIIDDLGSQQGTPWAKEKLDQLLNYRFINRLPTVITTSTPLEELEERIRTRLTDPRLGLVYHLETDELDAMEFNWAPGLELQKTMTFANFDYRRANLTTEEKQNLEQAYRLAFDFARAPENWIVFMGTNGCGKTHLAAAIAGYRYQAHKPAMFIVVPEFLDHLRSAFSPQSKLSYDRLFEKVKMTELLILDDFGEQETTPWAQEKLYQLINYRYNAKLPTVITTSRSLDEIEPRISSRLSDPKMSTPFYIKAPDYRCDLDARSSTRRRKQRNT